MVCVWLRCSYLMVLHVAVVYSFLLLGSVPSRDRHCFMYPFSSFENRCRGTKRAVFGARETKKLTTSFSYLSLDPEQVASPGAVVSSLAEWGSVYLTHSVRIGVKMGAALCA